MFSQLLTNDAWRKKLEAAGFVVIPEAYDMSLHAKLPTLIPPPTKEKK